MTNNEETVDCEDLFLSRDPEYVSSLLDEWTWLIGPDVIPFAASVAGDAFVIDHGKNVFRLDFGSGELIRLANSTHSFYSTLDDLENRNYWLLANFVQFLRSNGLVFRKGECYSFVVLPILGGKYELPNMMAISAKEHFALTGTIHKQVAHLPDGSKIQTNIVP
jgi:hypothetical protein